MPDVVLLADQKLKNKSPRERFLLARACACLAFPYLEQVIVAMGYAVDERIKLVHVKPDGTEVECPTMCVTDKAQILVHPEFLEKILSCGGTQALGFVIAHEAFHVLMNHSKRRRKMEERPNHQPKLAGLAADLAINPSLAARSEKIKGGPGLKISPPTGELTGVFPADFGFEDGLTMEGYYNRLVQLQNKMAKEGKDGPGEKCSGMPGQGCLPKQGDGDAEGEGELSEKAKQAARESGSGGWSENRTQQMIQAAARAAKEAESKERGSVPAGMLLELEDAIKEPRIPWTEHLRAHFCYANDHRPGHEDSVWIEPSRKQAGLGYGIGSPRLPGTREYIPRVGIVLDTSGSMLGGALQAALAEVLGIIEAVGGQIEIIYCDTQAHNGGTVSTLADIASQIRGGGGTDMTAALDMAKQKRCDIVVCLTDGYIGSFGNDRGYPLIFCITPGGWLNDVNYAKEAGWATVIQIDGPEES